MKYTYFVSYWFTDAIHKQGFGHVEMIRDAPISSYRDLVGITEMLEEQGKMLGQQVVILNYILIGTEPTREDA